MAFEKTVHEIRYIQETFHKALDLLGTSASFRGLREAIPDLDSQLIKIEAIAAKTNVRTPCDGKMTCAVVGGSSHGKTTLLRDMFPTLAERKWLVTEMKDTTAQALRVSQKPSTDPNSDAVMIASWDLMQIKELTDDHYAKTQNEHDAISVSHLADHIIVDASNDPQSNKYTFPKKIELWPFSTDYEVPATKRTDTKFIKAATVKASANDVTKGAILETGGRSYNSLQLRAVVKHVALSDPFDALAVRGHVPPERLKDLVFVDTPGIGVTGVTNDEALRHVLAHKSNHIVLDLLQNDELDIILHVVICGGQSSFVDLWTALEGKDSSDSAKNQAYVDTAEASASKSLLLNSLSERTIVVINGANKMLEEPDLIKHYSQDSKGDHLNVILRDNIVSKMSPRGTFSPAAYCFVDSKQYLEAKGTDYAEHYRKHRETMLSWTQEGNPGFNTLKDLNLVDTFRSNVEALCDPDDCGQGHLVRTLLHLIDDKGSRLVVEKYIKRSGLNHAYQELLGALRLYFEQDGTMNRIAIIEAARSCLGPISQDNLHLIETFIEPLDHLIIVFEADEYDDDYRWVGKSFDRAASIIYTALIDQYGTNDEAAALFKQHYDLRISTWRKQWGYDSFTREFTTFAQAKSWVMHALRHHAREILYQLVLSTDIHDDGTVIEQDEQEREIMFQVIQDLSSAFERMKNVCGKNGVIL
jgi:hypothetical protein